MPVRRGDGIDPRAGGLEVRGRRAYGRVDLGGEGHAEVRRDADDEPVGDGVRGVQSQIAASSSSQSAAVRAIGPAWSSVAHSGQVPASGTRPNVGLTPTTPQ